MASPLFTITMLSIFVTVNPTVYPRYYEFCVYANNVAINPTISHHEYVNILRDIPLNDNRIRTAVYQRIKDLRLDTFVSLDQTKLHLMYREVFNVNPSPILSHRQIATELNNYTIASHLLP